MKTKFFLLMTTIFMIVSCGPNPKVEPSNGTDTSKVNTASEPESESEKKETMPTNISFYQNMLDHFCKLYYKKDFDWNYKAGSIVIEKIDLVDEDQVFITGLHSYKGNVGMNRGNREFRATVLRTDKNEYEVTFEKKSRGAGTTTYYWEPSDHTITYP